MAGLEKRALGHARLKDGRGLFESVDTQALGETEIVFAVAAADAATGRW